MSTAARLAGVLIWFRRDLRLADHPALLAAVDAARDRGRRLTPVFVIDPRLADRSGPNRRAMLGRSLAALRADGVPLVVRHGDPAEVLPRLADLTASTEVYCTADFAPYGRARDERVDDALRAGGRRLHPIDSPYAVTPGTVLTKSATPFQVFTPFHRAWIDRAAALGPHPAVDPTDVEWRTGLDSDPIPSPDPDGASPGLPQGGEHAAAERWAAFRDRHLDDYAENRNRPDLDCTSRLSIDLKYGTIHPRQLLPDLAGAPSGSGRYVFRSELAWREFYADVLWHRPESARHDYTRALDGMDIDHGPTADERFVAWTQGRTGFPFIDAGMRQLLAEGWMHNRVRMAVASFLVKDLHLDWRRGAAWFMRHLADGDLASNQHGWQWTAGTGTDAAPYFRIFNPTNQGRTFDPHGDYIRRYVAELRDVRGDVHEPAVAATLFDGAGAYPAPIVDHAAERGEALARLELVKRARR